MCFCIGVSIVQLEQINVSCIGCRCTNKGEKDWFAVFEFFFSINHSFTSNVKLAWHSSERGLPAVIKI